MPAVHEISTDLASGHRHGTDGTITTTLRADNGKMFKRRAVKWHGAIPEEICLLVTELDGVRVYQYGQNVIVTREDLNP